MIPLWAKGVVALAIAAGGFWAGVKVTNDHWKADMLEAQQDHAAALKAAYEKNNRIARELEESRANVKTVFKTVTKRVEKVVDRPVYVRECFDDDGLRIANDALRGAVDTGQPDPAVPPVKPPG